MEPQLDPSWDRRVAIEMAEGYRPHFFGWRFDSLFESAEAFAAHQARTKDSAWGKASSGITREFTVSEVEA